MEKLSSNFRNMVLVLSGISIFSALALSSVFTVTQEPIAMSKMAKKLNAIKEVLPPYDRVETKPTVVFEGADSVCVYMAYDANKQLVGGAVEAYSESGYNGHIGIIVGFDKEGAIVNYSVLEQHETPGLGAKMVNWFKSDLKKCSIIGKNPSLENLTLSKNGGSIDAITGATISSKAFLFAVTNAHSAYARIIEGLPVSTATESNDSNNNSIEDKDAINTEMKGESNE